MLVGRTPGPRPAPLSAQTPTMPRLRRNPLTCVVREWARPLRAWLQSPRLRLLGSYGGSLAPCRHPPHIPKHPANRRSTPCRWACHRCPARVIERSDQGTITRRSGFVFGHNQLHRTGPGQPALISFFHPSQQNTSTGRLTEEMFRASCCRPAASWTDASGADPQVRSRHPCRPKSEEVRARHLCPALPISQFDLVNRRLDWSSIRQRVGNRQ